MPAAKRNKGSSASSFTIECILVILVLVLVTVVTLFDTKLSTIIININNTSSLTPVKVKEAFTNATECEEFRINPTLCLGPWVSREDVPEEWLNYLTSVYGKQGVRYPFDPTTLKFFYSDMVPFKDANVSVVKFKDLPSTPFGHLYECGFQGNSPFWCVHAFGKSVPSGAVNESSLNSTRVTPFGQPSNGYWYVPRINRFEFVEPGFKEGQLIEVTHECCDNFNDSEGMWFFHNPGSGVYLQLGRTATYRNKTELCDAIRRRTNTSFDCHVCCGPLHQYLIPHLRLFADTIIFTESVPGGHTSVVEVWDVRETKPQVPPSSCAPVHDNPLTCNDCTARFLFHGYSGIEPCICNESIKSFLSCIKIESITVVSTGDMHGYIDGVPILAEFLHQRRKLKPLLLFSTGDAFVGSAFFQQNGPVSLGQEYRPLRYDAMGLGNHDLEYYGDLSAFAAEAGPLVCFNLNASGVLPWVRLVTLPHLRACATGFTTIDYGVVNETAFGYSSPGSALFWTKLHAVLKDMEDEGCRMMFVLGHGGLELDKEVAKNTSPSVVVLGGHDHDIFFEKNYADSGQIIMHAGAELLQAGVLDLNIMTDPRSGAKIILEAHGRMLPLIDEDSRTEGTDGPTIFRLSLGGSPLHSRDCRFGRCDLGDIIAELMFIASCQMNSTSNIAIGALREAGSLRSTLGVKVTEQELRNVLLWNNNLVVAELKGSSIASMLKRSRESIAKDGGGASLSLFGVRTLASDNAYDIEVLTDTAAERCCKLWEENPAIGAISKATNRSVAYRSLGLNETVHVVVTNWLLQGGDGFHLPIDTSVTKFETIGPEVDVILSLKSLKGKGFSDTSTGILGALIGAIAKGFTAALVYGCSRTQTREIVFRHGRKELRSDLSRVLPLSCLPGCFVTALAISIGHFLFWSVFRSLSFTQSTMLASTIAAITVAVVENPLWVIVTKMQASDDNDGNKSWLLSEFQVFIEISSNIQARKGPKGFFDGLVPNLLLILHPILQANLYTICVHSLVSVINNIRGEDADDHDLLGTVAWLSMVAGITSTACTTLITYPLQVIRIRLQMDQSWRTGRYFDGIIVKGIQAIISSAITFFFMDFVAYRVQSFSLDQVISSVNDSFAD